MKKAICLLMILLVASLVWGASIPTPFEKAKEIALKATPNQAGNQLMVYEIKDNGITTTYLIGYLKDSKMIGIGKSMGDHAVVAEYREDSCEFSFYILYGMGGVRKEATAEEVVKFGFQIFRELVARGLL